MTAIYKIIFSIIFKIATSDQALGLYKHVLTKLTEQTEWEWDDELIEQIFKDKK